MIQGVKGLSGWRFVQLLWVTTCPLFTKGPAAAHRDREDRLASVPLMPQQSADLAAQTAAMKQVGQENREFWRTRKDLVKSARCPTHDFYWLGADTSPDAPNFRVRKGLIENNWRAFCTARSTEVRKFATAAQQASAATEVKIAMQQLHQRVAAQQKRSKQTTREMRKQQQMQEAAVETLQDAITGGHQAVINERLRRNEPSARGEAAWAELQRRLADAEAERAEMEDERAEMEQQLELAQQRQAEQDDIATQQQEQLKAQLTTIKYLTEMNKKLTEELAAIEAAALEVESDLTKVCSTPRTPLAPANR